MKQALEHLKALIPGICQLEVRHDLLETSNHDILLYSLFESEAALAHYQTHPEHLRVSNFVGTIMTNRVCLDFSENVAVLEQDQ